MTGAAAARTIALVGRANAGKTSLLMHLTGTLQRPVNFPGSSVECVASDVVEGGVRLCVVDLPGLASMQAQSSDEQAALDALQGRAGPAPDLLCAVLDASKLAVELAFLRQLRRLGRPLVVALTKTDVAASEGFPVDAARLQLAIGLPLVVVDGRTGAGAAALRALLAGAEIGGSERALVDRGDGPAASPAAVPPRAIARSATDAIDRWLLHPVCGPIALVAVMVAMFQLVFVVADPAIGWIEAAQDWFGGVVGGLVAHEALRSFLVDGMVNGVGSSLVFVPQIALLYAFVTVVEASGYMARAVFLLDQPLRKVGLSGKSFVPLTSSFACAIPGIVAARILGDERDRIATIVTAPLMSCSARLPVYVVMLAAFFPPQQAGLLLFLLYALGIVAAVGMALLLRRTALQGGGSLLVMELPSYQRPRLRLVAAHTAFAVKSFLRTAGTVILVATVVVWALGYFPRPAAIGERFTALRAEAPAGEAGAARRAHVALAATTSARILSCHHPSARSMNASPAAHSENIQVFSCMRSTTECRLPGGNG